MPVKTVPVYPGLRVCIPKGISHYYVERLVTAADTEILKSCRLFYDDNAPIGKLFTLINADYNNVGSAGWDYFKNYITYVVRCHLSCPSK